MNLESYLPFVYRSGLGGIMIEGRRKQAILGMEHFSICLAESVLYFFLLMLLLLIYDGWLEINRHTDTLVSFVGKEDSEEEDLEKGEGEERKEKHTVGTLGLEELLFWWIRVWLVFINKT